MNKSKKYTDQDVVNAVRESYSYRAVLIALKLAPVGGNYACIKRKVEKLGCDTRHFTGQLWSKGQTIGHRKELSFYLVKNGDGRISSYALKNRLIKEGLKKHICENTECNLTSWLGRKVPLELDHINGDRYDNRIENLRLLCPNCHALTPTYRGKNKGRVMGREGFEPSIP